MEEERKMKRQSDHNTSLMLIDAEEFVAQNDVYQGDNTATSVNSPYSQNYSSPATATTAASVSSPYSNYSPATTAVSSPYGQTAPYTQSTVDCSVGTPGTPSSPGVIRRRVPVASNNSSLSMQSPRMDATPGTPGHNSPMRSPLVPGGGCGPKPLTLERRSSSLEVEQGQSGASSPMTAAPDAGREVSQL